MCGNIIFDKSVAHTQSGTYPMPTVFDQSDYKFSGFARGFVAMDREDASKDLTIGLGGWNYEGRQSEQLEYHV